MMDIFETFATDENAEVYGAWQKIGDAEFLIARTNNFNYGRLLTSLVECHRAALEANDEASDKLSNELMAEVFAETILLDWKGVSYQGHDLPYNKSNAKMVLLLKDFRAEVKKRADDLAAYRVKAEAEQVKKLTSILLWQAQWGSSLNMPREIYRATGIPHAPARRPRLREENETALKLKGLIATTAWGVSDISDYVSENPYLLRLLGIGRPFRHPQGHLRPATPNGFLDTVTGKILYHARSALLVRGKLFYLES
ncbi:MAG: hypothetical protein LBI87_01235 [Candidatus Accumulibacter sp.]|jgi:hypothetical protein|nr:hypothetical protein [Accumulibacter sp.]